MEITTEDRKELNDIVDLIIQDIYFDIDLGKSEKVKQEMGITNPYDFIMGMMFVKISGSISIHLRQKMAIKKDPNTELSLENSTAASQIISERMPELRKAVNQHL